MVHPFIKSGLAALVVGLPICLAAASLNYHCNMPPAKIQLNQETRDKIFYNSCENGLIWGIVIGAASGGLFFSGPKKRTSYSRETRTRESEHKHPITSSEDSAPERPYQGGQDYFPESGWGDSLSHFH